MSYVRKTRKREKTMTNFEFAQSHEFRIKGKYISKAKSEKESNYINNLFDNYIEITPKTEENQLVTLDLSSNLPDDIKGISKKISNITLNLKAATALAFELTINTETLESAIDYIKLALKITIELYCLSCVKLSEKACLLLLYLHKKDAYIKGIPEQEIFNDISNGTINITKKDYTIVISELDKMSTIAIKNGIIILREKMVLKY